MSRFPAAIRPEVERLQTSRIQEIMELGLARPDVIPLYVGEGDEPTPAFISEAAIAALRGGATFYTHKRGLPDLRQAIADYLAGLYAMELTPERVSVTASGMQAIVLVLQAILRPGEKVAVVSPVWPNIVSAVEIAGGLVTEVELDPLPEGGFALDLDRLESALDRDTRALFIASPGNPTGWMMEAEAQQRVLDLCRARGIWLIADEVYHRFVYDRPVADRPVAPSFLALARPEDPVIAVHSFSKAWAMTGWRVGWLVHPRCLGEIFGRLIEFSTSGGQAFLQQGCIAALREGEPFVRQLVERCHQGGELVYQALGELPRVSLARPRAAFYAFFRVEGLEDSLAFAKRLLAESGVGLAPGSAFGSGGEGHLRLCFASSHSRLSTALERLRPFLA